MARLVERPFRFPFSRASRWPNPEGSTGAELAILGRNTCWEAVGQARAVFNTLQQDIEIYIHQTSESSPQPVVWSLYMIGHSRETSKPTITFISSEVGPRRRIRTLIKSSGILDKHPGFVTMDIDRPPGCKSGIIVTLGGDDGSENAYNLTSSSTEVHQIYLQTLSNDLIGAKIYLSRPDSNPVATIGGLVHCNGKFFLTTVAHPFEKFWHNFFPETTAQAECSFDIDELSGLEDADEVIADMTSRGSITSGSLHSNASEVSSSFEGDLSSSFSYQQAPISLPTQEAASNLSPISASLLIESFQPSSADMVKMNADDEQSSQNCYGDNDDDDAGDGTDGADSADQVSEEQDNQTAGFSPMKSQSQKFLPAFSLCGPTISSANGSMPALDYALFELHDSALERINTTTAEDDLKTHPYLKSVAREPRSAEVVVRATSGTINGRLLATPSFMQPVQGMRSQQLWTVILESTLQKGVCGSWVLDSSSGDVYGHIVAGVPEDGFAYIIPLYEILDDLNHRFEGDWTLAAMSSVRVRQSSSNEPMMQQISMPSASHDVGLLREGLEAYRDIDLARHGFSESLQIVQNTGLRFLQPFGQWTRHERYNIEKWKCLECNQGHDEGESSPDYDSSTADKRSDSPTKGKGALYGSRSKENSRSPKPGPPGSRNSGPCKQASGQSLLHKQGCSPTDSGDSERTKREPPIDHNNDGTPAWASPTNAHKGLKQERSVQASSPFLGLIPREWNPEFATRRDLDYSIENKPYIEARAELGIEEENVVRAFMRGTDESHVCVPQADKVEEFCFGANLESLREEKGKVSEPFVAWLDERSFEGGKGRSRTYRGPLTARDLYKELKRPVRCLIPHFKRPWKLM
jgi:hypothetical protein